MQKTKKIELLHLNIFQPILVVHLARKCTSSSFYLLLISFARYLFCRICIVMYLGGIRKKFPYHGFKIQFFWNSISSQSQFYTKIFWINISIHLTKNLISFVFQTGSCLFASITRLNRTNQLSCHIWTSTYLVWLSTGHWNRHLLTSFVKKSLKVTWQIKTLFTKFEFLPEWIRLSWVKNASIWRQDCIFLLKQVPLHRFWARSESKFHYCYFTLLKKSDLPIFAFYVKRDFAKKSFKLRANLVVNVLSYLHKGKIK